CGPPWISAAASAAVHRAAEERQRSSPSPAAIHPPPFVATRTSPVPPLGVGDRDRVGAPLDRSKKGPTQIKHRKSIIRRRRAEASGRFRLKAAPWCWCVPIRPEMPPTEPCASAQAPFHRRRGWRSGADFALSPSIAASY